MIYSGETSGRFDELVSCFYASIAKLINLAISSWSIWNCDYSTIYL